MTKPRYKGAVAAGHELTADAAAMILRDGGSAFDAAIAGLWMACVCEPVFASPGGGGFFMAQPANAKMPHLFDFFVETPKIKPDAGDLDFSAILTDFGTTTQEFHIGAGASAAPGFVSGLFTVHEQLGRIPMRRLAEPAMEAARAGLVINAFQARLFRIVEPILTWSEAARALFAPGGKLIEAGAPFRNRDLADAIEAIAREGPRIATQGEIARAMLASNDTGGALRKDDLSAYRTVRREPLVAELARQRIFLNPPPSCGGALVADMLARLARHAERPVSARLMAAIIDRTDRSWRASGRDIGRFLGQPAAASQVRGRGTTHISVIDADGNAAAVTVTNGEGNGRVVPGCGFMLNNMLGEEDLNPNGFHAWRPGERLASMMAPTLMRGADGALCALGSGGSNRIRTAIFQVLARLVAGERHLAAAIDAPRLHVEAGHLDFEDFFREEERGALVGDFDDHLAWSERSMFFGGAHAVRRAPAGGLEAAGDPRRAGVAVIVQS